MESADALRTVGEALIQQGEALIAIAESMTNGHKWVSVKEYASEMGVHENSIYRNVDDLARTGEAKKVGGQWRLKL